MPYSCGFAGRVTHRGCTGGVLVLEDKAFSWIQILMF
jgi:hypothetical protein